MSNTSDSSVFAQEMRHVHRQLFEFARNPVQGMKEVPNWSWATLFCVQVGVSMATGSLQGLLARSLVDFLLGLTLFPISTLITSVVVALFFYYFFALFRSTILDFRRLYTVVVLANLPYLVFQIPSDIIPPITLVGFAFTCLLLIVGLVEQFQLERRLVVRIIGVIAATFLVIWIVGLIRSTISRSDSERFLTPKTLDRLEQELKDVGE